MTKLLLSKISLEVKNHQKIKIIVLLPVCGIIFKFSIDNSELLYINKYINNILFYYNIKIIKNLFY